MRKSIIKPLADLAREFRLGIARVSRLPSSIRPPATASARDLGDAARDRRDWLTAAEQYQHHLADHPSDAAIAIQLGHALKESGQYRAAGKAYRIAAELAPDDADLRLQIGHLAKLSGDPRLMFENYLAALQLDPDMRPAYRELLECAPSSVAEWMKIDDGAAAPARHHWVPTEPGIRPQTLRSALLFDPVQAAIRSVIIGRTIRASVSAGLDPRIERDYLASRLGVFYSSYDGIAQVSAIMQGLQGARPDQPTEGRPLHALGAVPAWTLDPDHDGSQPNALLTAYRRRQVEATRRFVLRPETAGRVTAGPLISVLLPVFRGPVIYVERAILSVLLQTYGNVELCIIDDCSERSEISALLAYYRACDPRVKVIVHQENRGIAAATQRALEAAEGDYVALLDHDDMLAHDAIERVVAALDRDPNTDLVYSDECKIDGDDVADELFTKPDWSPSLLLGIMYTGHLSVYRRSLVLEVGGFRSRFDFSQDYDLALRVAETEPGVIHLRECLYGWRMIPGSAAVGGKPLARLSNLAALQDVADRRILPARALALPLSNRLRYSVPVEPPLVSLIVPSDNEQQIMAAVASIVLTTAYPKIEIVVVTNAATAAACGRSTRGVPVRYVIYDKAYNFSDKCNEGAAASAGEYVVFFNDDVRVTDPEWLPVCLEALHAPGVGLVGPKLLYENGAVQHGGMVTGVRGLVGTAFHTFPDETPAHFGFAQTMREVSLICGACMVMRRRVFLDVGGFDAVNTPIAHSDVDLCFKVRASGLTCVYTAFTKLTHIGHLSIGQSKKRSGGVRRKDKADLFLLRRWGRYCADDPYFPKPMREILFIDSQEPFDLAIGDRPTVTGGRDILLVSHDLSNSGAPKVVFDLALICRQRGDYVLVVSPVDGPFRARLLSIGVDVMIDATCLSGSSSTFRNMSRNFDALIANTIVCWPVINQLADSVACFWYIHETELVGHLRRQHPELGREAGRAEIWAGSRMAADALAEISLTASVIEYGVDDVPVSRPSTAGTTVISVLATFEPRKGQDLAVLAFKQLPARSRARCELRLGGRINDPDFYRGLERLSDPADRVRQLGDLTLEAYRRFLAETDILLCPSRDDTLPLVTLDALAAGKILICSPKVGTSAYIVDGESGFVPRGQSPEDLAQAIERALGMVGRWRRISDAARDVYQRRFSMERFRKVIDARLATIDGSSASSS